MTALIVVCVTGGWIGAGVVASLSRRAVQLGMGGALLVAAVFMMLGMLGRFPAGGTALAFTPRAFALALAVNFVLGALLTLGIGNYAPSLVVFSLLGMDPRAAFPIMMGSGAFVATIAGVRFVGAGRFHWRAALGLTIGGIPGSGRGRVARQVASARGAARARPGRRRLRVGHAVESGMRSVVRHDNQRRTR